MAEQQQPARLGELLLLAALWMLFGFMLWYYLAALHVAPVRILADALLSGVLSDASVAVVPHPERHFLLQVETQIPFLFADGTREALGFIVNPLIYGYGLPVLFGLTMASNASLSRKAIVLVVGWAAVVLVQTWGAFWESLKLLAFNFGPDAQAVVTEAGIPETAIALCYQLGVLIFPPLVPVIIWVFSHWQEVEELTGRALPKR